MKEYKNQLLKLREGAKKAYFNYIFRYRNGFIRNKYVSQLFITVQFLQQLSLSTFIYARNSSLSNDNTLWTTVNRGLGLITL